VVKRSVESPHLVTEQMVKSEVAIASLLRQTKQPKKKLLEVKTITKSPGNGIAESVKSCNLHKKKAEFSGFKP
jgi:hypothetical protein